MRKPRLLETQRAGVCFLPTLENLQRAFHAMCANYSVLQRNSPDCAERYFNLEEVFRHYGKVYAAVTISTERAAGRT